MPIGPMYLNLISYHNYDQEYVNYFEIYIENGMLKSLSYNLPQNPSQGTKQWKTSYKTFCQYKDQTSCQ